MTARVMTSTGIQVGTNGLIATGSAHSTWAMGVNSDVTIAQTAAVRYAPGTVTDNSFGWLKLPQGVTGVSVRARSPIASTALTSPVVALVGAWDNALGLTTPVGVNDGTVTFKRLDALNILDAGQPLTFPASPSTSNCQNDAAWWYSAEPTIGGFDCRGAKWVGVFVMTAGASTASAAMPVDLLQMNG